MTSNLIALWSLKQKEIEAGETLRHNKEMEQAQKRREAIDEKIAAMNYEISKFNAMTNRYAAESNQRIALLNYGVSAMQAATAQRRLESDEKIAQLRLEQSERERVTNSYLTQRKQNAEERYRAAELSLKGRQLDQQIATTAFTAGMDLGKYIIGGLAFNVGRKVSKPAWIH